jgi:hypothetical protein
MQIYDDKNSNIKKVKLVWYKERNFTCIINIKKEKRNRGYYIIDERKKKKKKEIINIKIRDINNKMND